MKIVTTPSFRAFRPFFATTFVVVFAGLLLFGCQNHQTKPLFTTFSMPEHELITSLNSLNQDTLLVGTDQGNIYYYSPKTDDGPVDTLRVGNHRPVYVAYPSDLGLFVGVSNEGLKLFSSYGKSDRKPKQYLLQLNGDTCTTEYAVYKVLKFGDTLFCATSNGLYWLNLSNLKDTILKSLYPNRKLPDCKIERLYLEGDSLKVYYNDSILSFNLSGKFNTQHTSRPIPSDSREEMVPINNITYKFKQYDTKFYAYDTLTINPHNFVFVTSMNKDKIIAIADDDGIIKDVYVGNKGEKLRWNRIWTKRLRNVPGQITDFIVFPNESCLILTSEEVAYKGDKRGVQRLEFSSDTTSEEIKYYSVKPGVLRGKGLLKPKDQPNRVKSVYYSENFNKLYVALGAGYAYYDLDSSSKNPKWDSFHFVDYKDSADKSHAFRCFAEWDNNLCCGTIDDGCLFLEKKDSLEKTLPYQNIRYFKYVDEPTPFFVLTSDSLYVLDSLGNKKHKSAQENRYIHRLYCSKDGVFGISSGHIYIHYLNVKEKENVSQLACFPLDPTCGHVNPYAIFYDDKFLYIGTNKGLFCSGDEYLNHLTPVDIRDFWRTFNPVPFVLASVIVLLLVLGYLLYRFMKRRHEELLGKKKDENNDLNDQLKKIAKATIGLQEQLKMSPKENEGIEDKLKKVSNAITDLNGQLGKKDDDIKVLEGQLEKVAKATKGLQEQLKLNPEENEGLEEQLEKVANAMTGLQEQLKLNPEENEGIEEQLEKVANAITELNGQLRKKDDDIKVLRDQLEKVADAKKDLEKQLILDRYQKLYSSDLPEDEESKKSKDWVIRTASQYKNKYEEIEKKVKESIFTGEKTIEKIKTEIDDDILKYAFSAELYNLRVELHGKDLNKQENVKNVFDEIKDLSDKYLEKIVSYNDSKNHRTKKDVLLHFWIIALLSSEGEKTNEDINYIHNDEFLTKYISLTQYGKRPRSKGKKPDSPTDLRSIIGKNITTGGDLFKSKLEDDSLFKDIVAALKEEKRIKEYEPKSTENKEELKSLKEKLKSYATTMSKKEVWDNIIDMIKLLHGNQKEEKGFVFDGTVDDDKLPSKKLLEGGVRLDITNSNLAVSDFEDPLKELFNKVLIRDDIKNLKNLIETKGEDILKDESFYKQINGLCSSIKLMFKPELGEKVHDWEGALLLLTWGLVVNNQCRNKDFLQEFLQKMQNKSNEGGNMDKTELERWLKFLASYDDPSSIIKPKKQFAELFKKEDWKNARLSVLNLFGINLQL